MKNTFAKFMFICSLALVFNSYAPAAAAQGLPSPVKDQTQKASDPCFPQGVRSTISAARNVTNFVGTQPGKAIAQPAKLPANASPEDAARGYLSVCGSSFGLKDQASELVVKSQNTESNGARSFVHFQQVYQGIPVMAGELIVQVDQARNIVSTSGELLRDTKINIQPAVDAASAKQQAVQLVAKKYKLQQSDLSASDPELWIYDPSLLGPDNTPSILAWRLEVSSVNPASIRELVLVDAQRGSIALSFNQIDTAGATGTRTAATHPQVVNKGNLSAQPVLGTPHISVYTMNHSQTDALLPGTLVCTQSNPTACNSDPDAQKAYQYALDTYNFYVANFGRDSIDGLGMTIISSVHYGSGYQNAFWNGSQMVYGDGFSTAEDVVGHELTHGVTAHESNLFYYYQSGAINESMSDVFGELIEKSYQGDTDWLLGENLPIGAIRDMANPPAFSNPDKMTSGFYWFSPSDSGGVHTNSGINNKAAYLMTDGASFNSYTITGLGLAKVAKIYYEVQTNLLTSGSDYFDLYNALYQGCLNLAEVGAGGITAADCFQVQKATLAVEMNLQPSTGFNPNAPECPAGGYVPNYIFNDSFEAGTGNFVTGNLAGANPWYLLTSNVLAHTGNNAVAVNDIPTTSESYIRTANNIHIPAGAFLHFDHLYDFESPEFDGGVIEYSTNSGVSWNDAGSLIDPAYLTGYNGTINPVTLNPLAGRSGFVDSSHGYIQTLLNLSSLAGQNVMFRWVMGTDISGSGLAWVLDDVHVYTCQYVNVFTGVGGVGMGSYNLTPGSAVQAIYGSLNNGPVVVASTGAPIIASERVAYTPDGGVTWPSFTELMGLPSSLLTTVYVMPWYNNVDLNTQLRFGNVGVSPTNVTVTVGGVMKGFYLLNPNQSLRVSYAGLNDGPVIVSSSGGVKIIASERVAYYNGSAWTSFAELMGLPAGQLTSIYVMPWYNNADLNTQIRFGNVGVAATNVTVSVGGVVQGTYPLGPSQSTRVSYTGLNNGPVVVYSSGGVPIIASERVAYYNGSAWTSFTELMGLPASQLTTSYEVPIYDNVNLNTQLRFGNVGSSSTVVTVTVGGVVQGTYPLAPNQSSRVSFTGLNNGPVKIQSSGGVPIIASERVAYYNGSAWTSFAEMMGLPASQLTTSYMMPWYNSVDLNTELRFAVP